MWKFITLLLMISLLPCRAKELLEAADLADAWENVQIQQGSSALTAKGQAISHQFLQLSPRRCYRLKAQINPQQNTQFFLGFIPYDREKRRIESSFFHIQPKSDTVLVEAGQSEDRTILVENAQFWQTGKKSWMAFDCDPSGFFNDLPNFSVNPIVIEEKKKLADGLWRLLLQEPIGRAAAAGTAIRQHFGYGVYMYAGPSAVLPKNQFSFRQGAIYGRCLNICENFAFWPGVKYLKVILINFNDVTFQFKDVSLTEVSLEEAMKDNQTVLPKKPGELHFHPADAPGFQMEGLACFASEKQFRRFPLQPDPALPGGVESLSWHSAGAMLRFRSNTRKLAVKVKIENFPGFDHMSRIAQAGVDLYLGEPGQESFHAVSRISAQPGDYEAELFKLPDEEPDQMREFTLHLPSYSRTADLQIGLDAEAEIQPPTPRSAPGRIAVYGTSITQGACTSRPGLCYTSQLARKLNREFLNFGFSGSGRGEAEVATHLARLPQIDLFILDFEANAENLATMQQRLPVFLDILRKQQPDCKILLVSTIPFAGQAAYRQRQEYSASRDWQQELVRKRNEAGDRKLFFLDGSELLGADFGECSVDGVHPNDLGMTLMQQAMLPVIRKILE